MPFTATAPWVLSTVTVPALPWKTAKPGRGVIGASSAPEASAQLPPMAVQVPVPPSTRLLLRFETLPPSQKASVCPAVLTRLTWLAMAVCTVTAEPAGWLPTCRPLSTRVPV